MPTNPRNIKGPELGIADTFAFADLPEQFTPPAAVRNFRSRNAGSAAMLSTRPGKSRLFPGQYGGGNPVKAFCVVPQASGVSEYAATQCTRPTTWVQRRLGAIAGSVWIVAPDGGLIGGINELGTRSAGHTVLGSFVCCWHPTLPRVFLGTLINSGTQLYMGVHCYNIEDGSRVWQTFIGDANSTFQGSTTDLGRSIVANEMQTDGTDLLIAAGPYMYVVRVTDGVYMWRHDLTGWSQEVQGIRRRTLDRNQWLVSFDGTRAISGPVVGPDTDGHGRFARAGVFLYRRNTLLDARFERRTFSTQLDAGDPLYENHTGLRLSEKLFRRPRGARVNGFATSPLDDTFVVGMTNRGWGFNPSTHTPGDAVAPSTIAKFSANGQLVWEVDTQSIMAAYTGSWGTYYNDIPQTEGPGGPEFSVNALIVDSQNRVFAAGKRNQTSASAGHNVFAFDSDGALLWRLRLSGTIYQHCLRIDPNDGNLLAFGKRNSDWDNGVSAATNAHGWKIDAATGVVLSTFDLGQNVSVYAVDVNRSGQLVYCSDII